MKKTILYVHHSADLYGSDKALLSLVTHLDTGKYHPIVALPGDGPLADAFRGADVDVFMLPLVTVARKTLKPSGLLELPRAIRRSMKAMNNAFHNRRIDLVHSNTVAVLSGALWAKRRKIPHLWHVHEIIDHPYVVSTLLTFLVRRYSDAVVANSQATLEWLVGKQRAIRKIGRYIWNGIEKAEGIIPSEYNEFRRRLGLTPTDVLVTLMGRINRWKGQKLLIDAADILWGQNVRNVRYLMVGSPPPGQNHFLHDLFDRIAQSPAKNSITVMDFQKNVWPVWHATDIAVIPSIEPEPFGLVALEAMAVGKPVIAASHGGLTEIVKDLDTGLLVPPGDPKALADSIQMLAENFVARMEMGKRGIMRQQEHFTLSNYRSSFEKLYQELI